MGTDAPSLGKQVCGVHLDRVAVERCESCGRPACLACAVPVRARILCTECAARQVGAPRLAAPSLRRRPGGFDLAAAAFFGLGLVASLLPWDRFGILTSALSGWRADPEPWPLVASLCQLLGAAAAVAALAPVWQRLARLSAVSYAGLGAGAALATALTVFGGPAYVTHTPAPYVGMVASAGASVLGIALLRRRAA